MNQPAMPEVDKEDNPAKSAEGMLFDHYEVEKTLGRGAMGVVYLARDLRIGRRVALKTTPRMSQNFESEQHELDFLERFRREAELCGSLIHRNIITLYEVGWEGRRINYLAMEYVDGESLLSMIAREGRLSADAAFKITDDVLNGLAWAHARHVIHRDIKPANILISIDGEAKIADFGVARYARSAGRTLTDVGQLIGTPYYMAPELIAGKSVQSQSDLFSVGVVLFEMLTGKKPFEGPDLMDVLYNVVNTTPPDIQTFRPDLPRWVSGFVRRLIAKNPADRFASAEAAMKELRRLMGVSPAASNPLLQSGRTIPVVSNLTPEETPTTPITLDYASRKSLVPLNRTVPTALGLTVILLVVGVFAIAVGLIQREVKRVEASEIVVPIDQEGREAMLREANILLEAGQYEASLARFQAYLAEYPFSEVARTGEERALEALRAIQEEEAVEQAEKERRWRELQRQREAQRKANSPRAGIAPVEAPSPAERTGEIIEVAANSEASAEAVVPPKKSFWSRIFKRPTPPSSNGLGQ
ncbi:MAG: serine/threonine protein kinase [Thermoanaerobaculia bacterium]